MLNASLAHPKRVYALAGGALVVVALIFHSLVSLLCQPWMKVTPCCSWKNAIDQPAKFGLHLIWTFKRRILKQVPEVARIVARTGSDELGLDPYGLK